VLMRTLDFKSVWGKIPKGNKNIYIFKTKDKNI